MWEGHYIKCSDMARMEKKWRIGLFYQNEEPAFEVLSRKDKCLRFGNERSNKML